uniref:Uncharacterized protein n=1 Tax=Anopheles quadriannulatus TaxID=34691 RepID=A0A182XED5_ANOQN
MSQTLGSLVEVFEIGMQNSIVNKPTCFIPPTATNLVEVCIEVSCCVYHGSSNGSYLYGTESGRRSCKPLRLLLTKLERLGYATSLLKWFRSYLTTNKCV